MLRCSKARLKGSFGNYINFRKPSTFRVWRLVKFPNTPFGKDVIPSLLISTPLSNSTSSKYFIDTLDKNKVTNLSVTGDFRGMMPMFQNYRFTISILPEKRTKNSVSTHVGWLSGINLRPDSMLRSQVRLSPMLI